MVDGPTGAELERGRYGGDVARGDDIRVGCTVVYLGTLLEVALMTAIASVATAEGDAMEMAAYWPVAAVAFVSCLVTFRVGYTGCLRGCATPPASKLEVWAVLLVSLASVGTHAAVLPFILPRLQSACDGCWSQAPTYALAIPFMQLVLAIACIAKLVQMCKAKGGEEAEPNKPSLDA